MPCGVPSVTPGARSILRSTVAQRGRPCGRWRHPSPALTVTTRAQSLDVLLREDYGPYCPFHPLSPPAPGEVVGVQRGAVAGSSDICREGAARDWSWERLVRGRVGDGADANRFGGARPGRASVGGDSASVVPDLVAGGRDRQGRGPRHPGGRCRQFPRHSLCGTAGGRPAVAGSPTGAAVDGGQGGNAVR